MSRTNDRRPTGRLRGVSLGPGAPDLITVRAVEALKESDRIYYPVSSLGSGASRCLSILCHYGLESTAKPFEVSMENRNAAEDSYRRVREMFLKDLCNGFDVAVVCEGCLSLYSTTFRILCDDVFEGNFELIPGVSSPSAAAAAAAVCLGLDNDKIAVIPGGSPERDMELALERFETVVVLKPTRAAVLARLIREKGLEFLFCRDIGGEEHFITGCAAEIEDSKIRYFSLLIISKRINCAG